MTENLCPISPLVHAEMIETRQDRNGQTKYRIKGIVMAWCDSLLEALRVAHILIRAGRVSLAELAI